MATERTIRWLKTVGPDESIVFAAIDKLDALWRSSSKVAYLAAGAGSWDAFYEAAAAGALLQAPRLQFLTVRPPTIAFASGRFRFSFCRDHGAKTLPVVVPREDAELAAELLGYEGPRVTTIQL